MHRRSTALTAGSNRRTSPTPIMVSTGTANRRASLMTSDTSCCARPSGRRSSAKRTDDLIAIDRRQHETRQLPHPHPILRREVQPLAGLDVEGGIPRIEIPNRIGTVFVERVPVGEDLLTCHLLALL